MRSQDEICKVCWNRFIATHDSIVMGWHREEADDFSSLKDIDIHTEAKSSYIATTTENGRCEIWDVENTKMFTELEKQKTGTMML